MSKEDMPRKHLVEREAAYCAERMVQEITGGRLRPEAWYRWYLCERHGGPPLLDAGMPRGQVAYWDGEDIVLDACAAITDIAAALPEELTHRLSSRETPRFEWLNSHLKHAHSVGREVFQEMVGQRVAALFSALLRSHTGQ
ncbi:MAG TPA: hypothetical protein VFB38_05340 [Chthonomonadaceae bacterium]|nr:hypothetical protein [Chthonomonadaceae bacterium]